MVRCPGLILTLLTLVAVMPGCSNSGETVKLQGAGASFPAPLYNKWFKEFRNHHKNINIDYQSVGSGQGVKSFIDGTVDFGASDAAMTSDEIAKVSRGVVLLPMTAGTIVLAYNLEGVKDLKLSREAYAGIFLGKITRWNDPVIAKTNPGANLPDKTINVIVRSDSSGTTYVFTKHLAAISPEFAEKPGVNKLPSWPVGTKSKGNEGVTASIIIYREWGRCRVVYPLERDERMSWRAGSQEEIPLSKLRVALIGCGKVGQIHARAMQGLPEADLVAVCDASLERAEAFASQYGVNPFTDLDTLIRQAQPEAVLIATPHPLHAAPAIRAAQAGVHVLVEKPLAANLEDCDAMLAAAAQGGVQLGVISQRRFYEPVRRMKTAIDAGKIGRPVLGVFTMYSWRDPSYYESDPWRGKWASEGGGVLVNQSPHQLDLLQWFMGPIAEISGYWANLNHPSIEVDDTAVAMIRFQSGGLGAIVTSVSQKPGIHTKVHIHGSNGASVGVETDRGATFIAGMTAIAEPPLNDLWTIPGEERKLAEWQAQDRARFQQVDAATHYHRLQIVDFLQAIQEERAPLVTGEEGRRVVEMFTAIYRSNEEKRPVALPL